MTADHVTVFAEAARAFCQEVFERAGFPKEGAFLVADPLVDADPRGVSTILAIDIGACRPVPEFVQGLDEMVRDLKATPKVEGAELGVQWPA